MQNKWKVSEVDINDIVPTSVNANKMTECDFNRLVENIRKTGLSSMIACYKRESDGKYVIISGNHRYKACVKLGYSSLNILWAYENELDKDEIIALQLSHNSLHGEDDKGILKRLFEEIQSIDYKIFSNIDVSDFDIDTKSDLSFIPISEHYAVSFILYRQDLDNMDELFDIIDERRENSDLVLLANGQGTKDLMLDAMTKAKKGYKIKSTSVALSKIFELALEKMKELENDSENIES